MTAPNRALLLCRRHFLALMELAGLLVCFLVVRLWVADLPPLQLLPSAVLLLFLFPPPPTRPVAEHSWMTFLRVPAAAGINYLLLHFIADDTRGLRLALGSWSVLAVVWALIVLAPRLRSSGRQLSSNRRPVLKWLLSPPMANIILPIVLAWGGAIALHHAIYPSETRGPRPQKNAYGPVHLKIKLADTRAGIPEPLVICGKPGQASMAFIRLLDGNRAKVGVEFWGFDLNQGTEFPLPADGAEIDVVCEMPGLYPGADDSAWNNASPEIRREHSSRFRVTVNGVVRLEGSLDYAMPRRSPLYFGANPLGGSFISSRFSGTILQATQGGLE